MAAAAAAAASGAVLSTLAVKVQTFTTANTTSSPYYCYSAPFFFPLHVSLRVNVLKSLLRKAVSPFDSSHTHIHTKREKKFSFFYTAFSVEALQMASAPNKHRSNTKRIQQRKVMCAAVSGALQAAGPRTKNLRLLFSS